MTGGPREGRRRIDRVLEPGFVDGIDGLPLEDVRRRRDMALAEREYLSFLRRLLQGRLDILAAERERRASGTDAAPLVERLSAILAEGTRGPSRGEAPVVAVPNEEVALARRRVERLVSDLTLSSPEDLPDDRLNDALDRLRAEEREVSDVRGKVIGVHDALQGEIKRRYRAELTPET